MEATSQQFAANTATSTTSAAEKNAQPNAQITEGGFSSKVASAVGADSVDDVQQHAQRQTTAGAEDQMEQAQQALNSK